MGSLCSQNRIVVHPASTNLRSVSRSRFWLASNLPATRPDWLAAKCRDPGTRARSTHPRRRRGAAGGRRDPRADALLEVAVGSRRGIGVRDDGVTNAGRAHLAYPAAGWSAFVWLRPERMAKEIGPSPSTLSGSRPWSRIPFGTPPNLPVLLVASAGRTATRSSTYSLPWRAASTRLRDQLSDHKLRTYVRFGTVDVHSSRVVDRTDETNRHPTPIAHRVRQTPHSWREVSRGSSCRGARV